MSAMVTLATNVTTYKKRVKRHSSSTPTLEGTNRKPVFE
jgi:hypothetical protein